MNRPNNNMKLYQVGVRLNTLVWAPEDIEHLDEDTKFIKLTNILLSTEPPNGLLHNELFDSLEVGLLDSFDFEHYDSLDELVKDLPPSWDRGTFPLHADLLNGMDRDDLPSIEELWRLVKASTKPSIDSPYPVCPYCGSNGVETVEVGLVPRMFQLHCNSCKASSPSGTKEHLGRFWRTAGGSI